jgi:hypothetical protein
MGFKIETAGQDRAGGLGAWDNGKLSSNGPIIPSARVRPSHQFDVPGPLPACRATVSLRGRNLPESPGTALI